MTGSFYNVIFFNKIVVQTLCLIEKLYSIRSYFVWSVYCLNISLRFQRVRKSTTSSSFSSLRYFSSILFRGIFPLRLRYRFSFYFSKSLGEWNIEQPRSDSRSTINITARDTFDRCYERNVRPPAEDPLSVALITDLRFWNEQFLETPERSRFLGKSWRCLKNNRPSAGVSRRLKISNVQLLFPSFDRQSFFHTEARQRLLYRSFQVKLKSVNGAILRKIESVSNFEEIIKFNGVRNDKQFVSSIGIRINLQKFILIAIIKIYPVFYKSYNIYHFGSQIIVMISHSRRLLRIINHSNIHWKPKEMFAQLLLFSIVLTKRNKKHQLSPVGIPYRLLYVHKM